MAEIVKSLTFVEGERNRFKFMSFAQRLANLKLKISKKLIAKNVEFDDESHFVSATLKWSLMNLTTSYASLNYRLRPLSKNLPILIHSLHKVVEILIEYLDFENHQLSLLATLDLISNLSYDLDGELFEPHFIHLLSAILKVLDNLTDVDLVEAIFNTIATLFKNQQIALTSNNALLISTFELVMPKFNSRMEFNRVFSTQVFSFLLRKLKTSNLVEIYTYLLKFLDENVDKVDFNGDRASHSFALMFFEVVKQVNGTLHSKTTLILKTVIDITLQSTVSYSDASFEMLIKLSTLIGHHTTSLDHWTGIWDMIFIDLTKSLEQDLSKQSQLLRLGKICHITCVFATVDKGRKIRDRKEIFVFLSQISKLLFVNSFTKNSADEHHQSSLEFIRLFCSILETSSLESALVFSRESLDILFNSSEFVHIISFCDILRQRRWPHFPKLITPRIIKFIQDNFTKDPTRFTCFISQTFGTDFVDLIESVPKHLLTNTNQLKLKIMGHQQSDSFLADILLQQLKSTKTTSFSGIELARLMCTLNCLSFLAVAKFASLFSVLKDLFKKILNLISNGKRDDMMLCFGGNLLTILSSKAGRMAGDAAMLIELVDVVWRFVVVSDGNPTALKGASDFFMVLKSQRSDLFGSDSIEETFPKLEAFVCSPNRLTRLYALTIADCFEPIKSLGSNSDCEIIQFCLSMERIHEDLQNVRDKTIVLRKLEIVCCSQSVPVVYKSVGSGYCLALLSSNFMPFVEEVIKTLRKLADSDCRSFWSMFANAVFKVNNGTIEIDYNSWIPSYLDKSESRPTYNQNEAAKKAKKLKNSTSVNDSFIFRLDSRVKKSYQHSTNLDDFVLISFYEMTETCKLDFNVASFYQLLIRTMTGLPHIVEQRSHFICPLFFKLFKDRAESSKEVEKSSNSLETSSSMEDTNTDLRFNSRKQILEFLEMFSNVKNPQHLYESLKLKDIFLDLLSNGDKLIQEKALSSISSFKNKSILFYQDALKGLIDDERFRDSMALINVDVLKEKVLNSEDRLEFMDVFSRIMYGKLISRKGRGSSKAGVKARRTAIFSFFSRLENEDHLFLFDLMVENFEQAFFGKEKVASLFVENKFEFCNDYKIEKLPQLRVQIGFLTVLDDFIKQIRSNILHVLPRILSVLLNLLKFSDDHFKLINSEKNVEIEGDLENEDEEDDDDNNDAQGTEFSISNLKKIRLLIIRRLKLIFDMDLNFNFEPFIESIFLGYIDSKIVNLSTENTQSPSAILELFYSWSENQKYTSFLANRQELFPKIISLLSAKKVQESVVSKILAMVEALVSNSDESQTGTELGAMDGVVFESNGIETLIKPNLDLLLQNLNHVLTVSNGSNGSLRLNSISGIPNRILRIISNLSILIKNSKFTSQIVDMMLPFLKKSIGQVNEKTKMEILKIVGEYISTLDVVSDSKIYHKHFTTISQLFSTLESREARTCLVEVFNRFKLLDAEIVQTAEILENLNSFSKKRLDEPDYDRRFEALKAIGNEIQTIPARCWLPISHNLLYSIRDTEEYAVRTAAASGLINLLNFASKESPLLEGGNDTLDSMTQIVFYTVFPGLKKGLKFNVEVVRYEIINVLCHLVTLFPEHQNLTDMTVLLGEGNDDLNFFKNIYHLQVHRRIKALRMLAEECEKGSIASSNINNLFIPIVGHFIFESDRVNDHQIVNEAINSLSSCSGALPWNQYYGLIKRYFGALSKKPHLEKLMMRVVVAILDQFKFDMTSSPSDDMEIDDDEGVVEEGDEEEEELISVETIKDAAAVSLADKIRNTVIDKIIPELHKNLSKKEDENLVVRVPVAISIAKLLKKLPNSALDLQLPKLIYTLGNIMKSRQQSARDTTREILVKVCLILGTKYAPFIFKELHGILTKGYQLHVLGYTIHSLLHGIIPTIETQCPELDHSASLLVEIFVNDIFGEIGEEKEVEELQGKMREIKKTKSYDSFELLANVISMSTTALLLAPIKDILLETSNTKVTTKVDNVLKRIATGLSTNSSVTVQDLMVFVHELVNENLALSKSDDETKKAKTISEKNFEVQMKRPMNVEPIKIFQANAHRFVDFGFSLMLNALKRNVIDLKNEEHLGLLDPFLLVLGNALFSIHSSVIISVLKILTILIRTHLPSLEHAIPIIVRKLLKIVVKSNSTGSELIQTLFKLLGVVIRECDYVHLKESQLTTLLQMVKPDIEEPERQSVTFSLIRAIISRKYVVNVVYELMEDIAKIMITSQSSQVRELCRHTYLQFLIDYPQGPRRLQTQWNHIIQNMQYEFESGRESIFEVLNLILDKFPDSILFEHTDILFMSLVVSLVNDDSNKCRQMAGIVLKKLFLRNGLDRVEKLLVITDKWFEQLAKPEMLRFAAQTYGLVVDAFGVKSKKWISNILNFIDATLAKVSVEMNEQVAFFHEEATELDEEPEMTFKYWEAGYYSLSTLGKLVEQFPGDVIETENFLSITDVAVKLLLHPHQWLRAVSSRILGLSFSYIEPETLKIQGNDSKFELLTGDGSLYNIAMRTAMQLNEGLVTDEMSTQIVKNLVFFGKCLYLQNTCDPLTEKSSATLEDDESDNEIVEELKAHTTLVRLVKKLSFFVRASKSAKESHVMRMSIYKWFAVLISFIPKEDLEVILGPILATLYRSATDSTGKGEQFDDTRNLSNEILEMIKDKIGSNMFLTLYNDIRSKISGQREDRKQKRAITAVVNPEAAAKRKVSRNLVKKGKRKMKNQEFSRKKQKFNQY